MKNWWEFGGFIGGVGGVKELKIFLKKFGKSFDFEAIIYYNLNKQSKYYAKCGLEFLKIDKIRIIFLTKFGEMCFDKNLIILTEKWFQNTAQRGSNLKKKLLLSILIIFCFACCLTSTFLFAGCDNKDDPSNQINQ